MSRKFILGQERTRISKGIVTSAIIGGVLGAVAGFLYQTNISAIPGVGYAFINSPIDVISAGTVLGIFIGVGMNRLIGLYITPSKANEKDAYLNRSKLQLREEQMDISKRWVQTGEVTVHKEVLREEKNIIVPVTREELVIEKKVLDEKSSDRVNERTETIRIPISEECIEVIKHPAVKEDVLIYRRQHQENERVEEILKKEKMHMKTTGDPKIINKEK